MYDKLVSIYKKLIKEIPSDNILMNEFMYKHTTFNIGGVADFYIKVYSIEEIQYILKVAKKCKIPLMVIGNGSNILIKDNGIRGIVLKIMMQNCEIIKGKDYAIVNVDAGLSNAKLCATLLEEELTGFEFASGIPGTIGGGVKMNAGAFESEFKDIVIETTYIDVEDGSVKTLSNEEQQFSYRHSIFEDNNEIIISTKLKFKYGKKEEILEKIKEYMATRKAKQPIDKQCAGSTFKRGKDFIPAQLIDQCELKGQAIGAAQVSTMHAGFIINTCDARASEVIALMEYVKKVVLEKTGKKLEPEIQIVGEDKIKIVDEDDWRTK